MRSLALALALLCVAPTGHTRDDDDVATSRELAGIAEEQALLRRQLQRLRSTMAVLLDRIEAEGRTHTAELLREGLTLLDERSAGDASATTVENLMEQSRGSIERGQLVQSLERQEELIGDLERLLAVLMDRKNLENLEENIDQLRELQSGLSDLISAEQDLEQETRDLRERSTSPAQRALEAELARLIQEQSEALRSNEELGRSSGTMELELLERELSDLLSDQTTDVGVLETWSPEEQAELRAALDILEEARTDEARAARMRAAAELLLTTADQVEAATPQTAQDAPWAEDLNEAAAREERHARVSSDPGAQKSAAALARGAEIVSEADLAVAEAAARTAEALREVARGLLEEAAAAREPARAARDEASARLAELTERDTAGGRMAEQVQERLEQSAERDREGDPEAAANSMERAVQTLRQAAESLEFLGQALSQSQGDAARRAGRINRSLEALPAGSTAEGQAAAQSLEEARAAMEEASQGARQEQAALAAERAREALEQLERAAESLAQAREAAGREVASGARESAAAQQALAEQTRQATSSVSDGSMNADAEESVEDDLERASEAMDRAAEELSEGRSASAAGSQREAREALQRASEAAREGVTPSSPEDRARAEEQAREQERIREQILDLARRMEERKNASPAPNLDRADQAAQEASEALREGELWEGQEQEQEVQSELENTLEDLREEEEAYQRLRQEEVLFRIAEEVTQMLDAHREQMSAVREIDGTRQPGEAPSRAVRLRLRKVAREEESLATRAGEISDAIRGENSQVTAELMETVQSDLEHIARDLGAEGDHDTGDEVQARQRDVEEDLLWLLEALHEEQRRRQDDQQQQQQQQGQNQEGEQPTPPLVPDATELKLLRRMEVAVQEAVDEMLISYPELERIDDVDPLILEEILRLASRHERVTELFSHFRERVGLPPPDADEDDE